ncbi:MAG: 3-phosphoshikimate 1-carboxyvinyltransferase [Clostridiales bacterium]|nr:3-phosphoshikimate 1-carboxyvinyltransferase [Clostridiales bacterium]
MNVVCYPSTLRGSLQAIPSKSDAHRLLICAALAEKPTILRLPGWQGEDIAATLRCLTVLGASFDQQGDQIIVTPIASPPSSPVLHCGESGSTLRFLLPVVAALGCGGTFTGTGRLPLRPLGPLLDALRAGGMICEGEGLPLTIGGKLEPGAYSLPGDVSSQFVSGMLFALPLCGGGEVVLQGPLESKGYVDMTVDSLSRFHISVQVAENVYRILPGQGYRSAGEADVQGDWSNAAFFLAAGALGGPVAISSLQLPSTQGDAAVAELLTRFGAVFRTRENCVTLSAGGARKAVSIDARGIPDLVPILAVVASVTPGITRFPGVGRLRLKESDRLAGITQMLTDLGGQAWVSSDCLFVQGTASLTGGRVDCIQDHRIAMSAAIAATLCREETQLVGAEAVNKSYPSFFNDYVKLGGRCNVLNHG